VKKLFLFFSLIGFTLQAQYNVSGVVKDAKTKKPLPFATITNRDNTRLLADARGRFTLKSAKTITKLKITYVGYQSKEISINKKFLTIYLKPKVEELKTVVLKSVENPAVTIIKKVIANNYKNNYKKILKYYKYDSYNKLLVTGSPDSITSNIDTVYKIHNGKKTLVKLDSSNFELKKELKAHHLYLAEKISTHFYERGKPEKEKVIAIRMAGLKNPFYELLAIDFQSFDFYNNTFEVVGNRYKSPLGKNALNYYNYKMLDTLSNNTYLIYYKPKKSIKKIGIEGVLYIDAKTFALKKGLAELKGFIAVKATQKFAYQKKFKLWFPIETSIKIKKGNNNKAIPLFGGIIINKGNPPATKNDSLLYTSKNKKAPEDVIYFLTKTKNFNLQFNKPLKIKKASDILEIDENAADRKNSFWQKYRTDSLSKRGLETYRVIDSIGKKEKFEHFVNLSRKIFKGYFPLKNFDLNLSQIANFNNREGVRLGSGFTTNTNFSKNFKIKAYAAYGLKDRTIKYHISAYNRINKPTNFWIGGGYTDDLSEAAKLNFLFEDTSFSLINPRNLNISQFFNYKISQIFLSFDIQPNLETRIQLSSGDYQTKFNYQFISINKFLSDYKLSLASIAFQWTPLSKYMQTPVGKITAKNGQLKIITQLTKSFDNILKGDFNFTQFNFKISHKIKTLSKSTTSFLLQGGIVFGDAPISHLYNAFPNYAIKNPWQKRINLSGTNAFETMTFNEFISDKYVSFQVRQAFNRFKISKKIRPQINLVSRFAIGTIKHPNYQRGFVFKDMRKGYFESGLELNKFILKGFGFSFFYRYGAYHNPKFEDNIAIKLNYHFGLNF